MVKTHVITYWTPEPEVIGAYADAKRARVVAERIGRIGDAQWCAAEGDGTSYVATTPTGNRMQVTAVEVHEATATDTPVSDDDPFMAA